VLEESAAVAQARNIDLGFELQGSDAIVRAMPVMLHELVANLIDNAMRYTPAHGIVTAVVVASREINELRVVDNGPGIPPEERPRVFERFYRLHHGRSDGCGLGLAIVREIATASDARVILSEPAAGTGLVVSVMFPARPVSKPSPPSEAPSEAAASARGHTNEGGTFDTRAA
jgi:two-component system sensor histidine kinase TctE